MYIIISGLPAPSVLQVRCLRVAGRSHAAYSVINVYVNVYVYQIYVYVYIYRAYPLRLSYRCGGHA